MSAAVELGERSLYHGTSLSAWEAILRTGQIEPRGGRRGNWDHTVPSHEAVIYLTTAYATYFAACATQEGDAGVVLEIDAEALKPESLCCDEDAYALLDLKRQHADKDAHALAAMAKQALPTGVEYAAASLKVIGNCGYQQNIPLSAICRAVRIDWSANLELARAALEPVISPQNYRFFSDSYRQLTQWLFDASVVGGEDADFFGRSQPLPSTRQGLSLLRG